MLSVLRGVGINGGFWVGNTFTYRCTDQERLLEVPDRIGPDNDTYLIAMAQMATVVIFV
jgi:hypothetical protein